MKKLSYLLSTGVLVAMLAVVGCSKDDGNDPSPTDLAGMNFSGTWAVDGSAANSVTYEGTDRTNEGYSTFALTVNHSAGSADGDYTATNFPEGDSPWKPNGIWSFNNEAPEATSFAVTRVDGVVVNVQINDNTMTLDFTITDRGSQAGRTEAVEGDWSFILVKQ